MAGRDLTCFVTLVGSDETAARARLGLDSLRAFGGELRDSPLAVFLPDAARIPVPLKDAAGVEFQSLDFGKEPLRYPFAAKTRTCCQAEELLSGRFATLVWVNPECLFAAEPRLFVLGPGVDAAFRPVHIRNVGSPAARPPDDFWQAVYRAAGPTDSGCTVEPLIDPEPIRPYYNTHCFAVNPKAGLMSEWWSRFRILALDAAFQAGPCADELHRIFLHQAILSALVAARLGPDRIRLLPPEYSYPLHLHTRVPAALRAQSLDTLVCPVYEDPADLTVLPAHGRFAEWLAANNRLRPAS